MTHGAEHCRGPHLLVDGSAVGWLNQDFEASVGELLDVAWSQGRPSFPGVDVLAADGHDGSVVLIAPLALEAARRPLTLATEKSEHDFTPYLTWKHEATDQGRRGAKTTAGISLAQHTRLTVGNLRAAFTCALTSWTYIDITQLDFIAQECW